MKKVIAFLILAACVAMPSDKSNAQVVALKGKSVFVQGNNQAANKIRSLISGDKKACFILAPKEADAEASLAISDEALPQASNRVSGTLTLKTGELIWSATDLGALANSSAARLLYIKMQRAADCK